MIDEPITYSTEAQKTVNKYDKLQINDKHANYWSSKENEVKELKKEIKDYYILKQNFICSYCRQKIKVKHNRSWDTDHIVSKSSYPQFMFLPINLCVSCIDCNNHKLDKNVLTDENISTYPESSSSFLIIHPHLDNFEEHITKLGGLYSAKTDKGLFTIKCCNLIRFGGKNLGYDGTLTKNEKFLKALNKLMEMEISEDSEIKIELSEGISLNIPT